MECILFEYFILGDRRISVMNPGKTQTRSQDSSKGLVSRVMHILLVAHAKAVTQGIRTILNEKSPKI